jgi:hypothetical protein
MNRTTEVMQLRDALEKSNHEESIIDILKSLKRINMSAEMIKSTKIGFVVNTIAKKHKIPEVTTLSKELVLTWKNTYQSSQSRAGSEANTTFGTQKINKLEVKTKEKGSGSAAVNEPSEGRGACGSAPVGYIDDELSLQIRHYPEGRKKVMGVLISISSTVLNSTMIRMCLV